MPAIRFSSLSRRLTYLGLLAVLLLGLALPQIASAQQSTVIHPVRAGENLYMIADRYNVTVRQIMQANGLRNPNVIYVGQQLKIPGGAVEPTPAGAAASTSIPTPTSEAEQIHVVARGQTLVSIAQQYNVSLGELMRANNLRNANLIRVGQKLVIPAVAAPTALPPETPVVTATPEQVIQPTPTLVSVAPTSVPATPIAAPDAQPSATPTAQASVPQEAAAVPTAPSASDDVILINAPAQNQTVTSPAVVTGLAAAFEQQITVRILDESGAEVGLGVGFIDADMGQRGPFTATVPFAIPSNSQFGRIQVYSVSPRDGAVEHLSSVVVRLQGLDLDPVIDLLKGAIESKNYDELRSFMPPDTFAIGQYRSQGQTLAPDAALQQIKANYLDPGSVKVDLSVNGRDLLQDRVVLPADVRWVGFSTGWGKDGKDDAFLLIMERNGRAFWGGLLYVPASLIDYR